MTREEIEKKMDELARKYVETRDPEIIEELYNLRIELKRLEKESLDSRIRALRRSKPALGNGKARR